MAEETYSLQRLLVLRKITRAVSDTLRGQIRDTLGTLNSLLRPRAAFGDPGHGTGTERAFNDLVSLYQTIAAAKPFLLTQEISRPVEIASTTLELLPVEYSYEAGGKTVVVTSPLRWVVTYSGFSPTRLKELLGSRTPPERELFQFAVQYAAVSILFGPRGGVPKILEALRFPLTVGKLPEFGELPVTTVSAPISTVLPPDSVVVESTEFSGKDVFEEIVSLDEIPRLRDPLKEQLCEILQSFGEQLPAA
ncbi:MAG TPA: hypothetical protein VN893_04680 [Bryobacteraceae bacterium]|nr:hypothetical protein [Bryobacteraceae bacterium]